jgi:hypothetical protein
MERALAPPGEEHHVSSRRMCCVVPLCPCLGRSGTDVIVPAGRCHIVREDTTRQADSLFEAFMRSSITVLQWDGRLSRAGGYGRHEYFILGTIRCHGASV